VFDAEHVAFDAEHIVFSLFHVVFLESASARYGRAVRRLVGLLVLLVGCDRHEATPLVSEPVLVAVETGSPVGHSLVEASIVDRCEVTYACGMSHPGLGTFLQSTSIDLGTCVQTTSTQSGPFGERADASTESAPALPADCATLKKLVLDVTDADARIEQESARVDTAACGVRVTCKPDVQPKISVQRQTVSGSGHVVKLIQGLQSARLAGPRP
jgi:hypothetical protein